MNLIETDRSARCEEFNTTALAAKHQASKYFACG
jgi:hypothetical protein